MTVAQNEKSVHGSKPIELYEFLSVFKNYYYTSHSEEVVFQDRTYKPISIERSSVKVNASNGDPQELKISLPSKTDIIMDYGVQITPPVIEITVYRLQLGLTPYNSNYEIYWKGVIANVQVAGNIAALISPSVLGNALASSVPSVFYQSPCNHVLFDERCKMSRAAYMNAATITAINDNVITLSTTGGRPAGFFVAGEIFNTISNERRMIIAQSGNDISINFPFGTGKVGDTVEITAGCNHAFNGDCKNRFNNQINFGGFPYIPSDNPFTEGL